MEELIFSKRNKTKVKAKLIELDISYIGQIMNLQNEIYKGLINKDFYACSTQEEFEYIINENGKILGCIESETNKLIAIGVYVEYGYEVHNYGYDVEITGENLLKVGQIESTLVDENYRGNKLQKLICIHLEKICMDRQMKYICATVAPDNKYSLNTFLDLDYKVLLEKIKYGGLKRYILMKKL